MARPKKDTKAGKIATEKWRKTMEERYGSVTEKMKEVGRIGGQNGYGPDYRGGFASNKALAIVAGAKGGRISRRKSAYHDIFEENNERIKELLLSGGRLIDLADELNVPYKSLLQYVKKYIYNK